MSARGPVVQNFMQIPPRGGASRQMGEIYAIFCIYICLFLQSTHRSDPLRDFYVKRRGSAQGSAFLGLEN